MKELKAEKNKKEIVIKYEAIDGTVFDIKEECELYEKSAMCIMRDRFNKLIVAKDNAWDLMGGYEDNEIIGVKVESETDINTIIQTYLVMYPYYTKDDEYGKKERDRITEMVNAVYEKNDILLMGINCENEYYFLGPKQKYIENLVAFGSKREPTTEPTEGDGC